MSGAQPDKFPNRPVATKGLEHNDAIRFPAEGILLSIPQEAGGPRLLRVTPVTAQDFGTPVPPEVNHLVDPLKAPSMFRPDPRCAYCKIDDAITGKTAGTVTFSLAKSASGKVVQIDQCEFDRSMNDTQIAEAMNQLLDGLKKVAIANEATAVVAGGNEPKTNKAEVAAALPSRTR